MQKTMPTRGAVLLVITCLVGWGMPGAAPAPGRSGPNVAQVDRTSDWVCPSPTGTTGEFFDIPNLALSLTTGGSPVFLIMNLSWHGTAGTGVWLDPVIDGQQQSTDRLFWQTGNDGFLDIVAFQRVYTLAARIALACG